jgi:hypothetical protein
LQKIAGNCDFDGLGAGGRRFETGISTAKTTMTKISFGDVL